MQEPYTVVEQTGIVGLFEICFEQSWKLMKEILAEYGRFEEKIGSPRVIIKIAYQCRMVDDCEGWLALLESRNILAHTYSDVTYFKFFQRSKHKILPKRHTAYPMNTSS